MPRTEGVVLRLVATQEPGQAPLLADRREPVVPAGEDLVRIGLMADIPDELVPGCLEHPVQRDRQLHSAQVGAEMRTLVPRYDVNDAVSDLQRQLRQLLCRKLPKIRRTLYDIQ
jgi:hypothetical protein